MDLEPTLLVLQSSGGNTRNRHVLRRFPKIMFFYIAAVLGADVSELIVCLSVVDANYIRLNQLLDKKYRKATHFTLEL